MSVDILKKIDNVLDEYAESKKWLYLDAAHLEVEEGAVENKMSNNKINYFLHWYRLWVSDNINDFKDEDYEVNLLEDFIDEYLDNNNYTNTQKKFFDVEYFIQSCMDDGYDVYVNKGGQYIELSQKEIKYDYIWMTTLNDGKTICKTDYDMFIIKKID